ncbi:hypothetical protein ACH47X_10185 [Promicromonospora kroppenstedtii]|jgi:hypothetical protein|uniref:Uncharacterized protein n=1 Tax=Promicromonospora kroppenstedtii TaxID=440482 RepID=A0ABW7XIB7_9MICO|nr:hypothetical protein [Promicromonospora sukumoe]
MSKDELDQAPGAGLGSTDLGSADPGPSAFDHTWSLLRDTAEVHAARGEVAPVVRDLIASLSEDPLGENDTTIRLTEALDSPRVRSAREARERIRADLQNEVHTR